MLRHRLLQELDLCRNVVTRSEILLAGSHCDMKSESAALEGFHVVGTRLDQDKCRRYRQSDGGGESVGPTQEHAPEAEVPRVAANDQYPPREGGVGGAREEMLKTSEVVGSWASVDAQAPSLQR